ncbi:MAG: hypothetical protein LBK67_06950, partial [Coriobacteriales bacterium]|nr:hypothetical protein [Coriobacteriales bacterium]
TEGFGSGIRITSILTDAPLEVAEPINDSRCGDCFVCQSLCPAHAVSGRQWHAGLAREKFWDADACRETARARSLDSLHEEITLCGLCILMCPYTQRSLKPPPGTNGGDPGNCKVAGGGGDSGTMVSKNTVLDTRVVT